MHSKASAILLLLISSCTTTPDPNSFSFTLLDQHPTPLLSHSNPGAESNKYGFEGGLVLLENKTYHLFISEMFSDPKWTKTRLAHWTSPDGLTFTRQSTLFESTGDFTGQDPRASLFLPIPIFDQSLNRWTLFYSAFRSAPNQKDKWLINHDGQIIRALSQTLGPQGIAGPYQDQNIALQRDANSDQWEGLQGIDSFFPFQIENRKSKIENSWLAFYGSAQTEKVPTTFWANGLASAPTLSGPWHRLTSINPILYPRTENPHVHQLRKNLYAAIFDSIDEKPPDSYRIGYTFSTDGLHWTNPKYIQLNAGNPPWIKQVRTPLSLIPVGHDKFLVFFTATHPNGYSSMSRLTLQLQTPKN
jgi:hypothetical protein